MMQTPTRPAENQRPSHDGSPPFLHEATPTVDGSHPPVHAHAQGRRGARIGLIIGLIAAVAFAALLGMRVVQAVGKRKVVSQERAVAQERVQRKEPSRTVRPAPMKWTPRVDLTGTLKPWRDADIGFETSGRLVRVGASVGDKVKAGEVLAVLDASRAVAQVGQAESQVAAARASLALAEDTLARNEALAASKSIPEAQAEQARQQARLAKAQLEGALAGTRLATSGAGLHQIAAPFAGIVTKAPTGIGSVVNAGVPLIHVEDTSRFRLSATVSEENVSLVRVGAPVKILYRERVYDGKVIAVVPSLDQATRRAPVEIEVPNSSPDLLAWSFVRARIGGSGIVDAFRLPALARRPGSQDEVVKVQDGRAKVVKATFNVDEDGSLVVQKGIEASDEIVLSPNPDVKDGDAVLVAGPSEQGR